MAPGKCKDGRWLPSLLTGSAPWLLQRVYRQFQLRSNLLCPGLDGVDFRECGAAFDVPEHVGGHVVRHSCIPRCLDRAGRAARYGGLQLNYEPIALPLTRVADLRPQVLATGTPQVVH